MGYFFAKLDLSDSVPSLLLQSLLPSQVYSLFSSYLHNAASVDGPQALGAVFLSIYSCVRIGLSLREKLNAVYGLPAERLTIGRLLTAVVFSVLLLAGVVLTLGILIAGEGVFSYLSQRLALNGIIVRLWLVFRFALVGGMMFALVFLLYRALPARPTSARDAVWGTAFSSICWGVLSALFSFYVDHLHDYSLLYGSLSTAMVLLIWLYLTNLVLLFGACINAARTE